MPSRCCHRYCFAVAAAVVSFLLLPLQVPSLAFVPAKFASTNRMEVEALRNTIVRTIARAKRATMQQSQW